MLIAINSSNMKLSSTLFLTTFVVGLFFANPVCGTWSIIATDRATGQVGGAGATCRGADGTSLLDDDFGSGAGRGVLVGQASASHSSVNVAEQELRDGATPSQIIKNYEGNNDQWAAVNYVSALVSTGQSVSNAADTTGRVKGDYLYAVQGNRLSSTNVVTYASEEFRKKTSKGKGKGGGKGGKKGSQVCDELADRLMRSMEAAVKDGDGDSDCTPQYPADTAYLLVKKPSDDEDDPYVVLDVTSGNYDAVEQLREAYDEWRDENPCEKRPKPHERYLPPLHHGPKMLLGVAGMVVAFLGIGYAAKKKGVVCITAASDFDDESDNSSFGDAETPYTFQRNFSKALFVPTRKDGKISLQKHGI